MIIIKSQKNAIGEYNFVHIKNDSKICGYQHGDNNYVVLGEYETEERAKEVMEEIEARIRELKVAQNMNMNIHDFDDLESKNKYVKDLYEGLIFTMPKE